MAVDKSVTDDFPQDPSADEFTLEKGVKDKFNGTIEDSWFGTTQNAGNLLFLFAKIKAEDGEIVERRFSCGDDWGSYDGGVTAEHATKKNFNNNSNYGRLIEAAMNLSEKELRVRSAELEHLGPRNSKLWKGFTYFWEVFEESGTLTDRATGEPRAWKSIRLLPTAFIGVEDVEGQSDGSPAASGASPAASAPSGDDGPLSTVDDATATKIRLLAKSKDYPQFVDEVMGLTGVVENSILMVALGDEAFYNSLKES